MRTPLPPLNGLRVLEAAARHLSFSKAAEELHVTPAAVSHQIKALEENLGVPLFRRFNRNLQLTGAAQAGLSKLQMGFNCLGEAVDQIRTYEGTGILTVSVAPSFAAKWLVPRLHRFADQHANIDMRISASMTLIDVGDFADLAAADFLNGQVDVAIRFGKGKYPGFRVDKLLPTSIVPMCSPALLTGSHPLRTPSDLRHQVLLHDDTAYEGRPDWAAWLKAAGVKGVNAKRGVHFSHIALALEAAIDGQGVVLGMHSLATSDLIAGRLVVPFEFSMPVELAYYVVCPAETADRPKIAAFRDWLLHEARLDSTDGGSEQK